MNNPVNYPGIRQKVDLAPYNTLGVNAVADKFIDIKSTDQLKALYRGDIFADKSLFILGGGSNILIKEDLKRPVLKISIPGIEITEEFHDRVTVKAGAGVIWHDLVTWCVERELGGIENLALIPGTVGAAPIQNIGAYGVELKDLFYSLQAFFPETGEFRTFQRADCKFGYRDSIFKNALKGKVIVTDVRLTLKKPPHNIEDSYYALQQYFEEHHVVSPDISDLYHAVIDIRRSKLPDPKLIGNAGSFFKNPVVGQPVYERLIREYPGMPSYPAGEGGVKIPAGWLIEKTGWKGKKVGNVGTYKNQALVIVNHGGATGEEIYQFAQNIRESVKSRFGIELVPEVNILE